ncbi:MAG: hypothetical protein JWO03_925 [Bacteroidetes bacterium]|nr:hypothetical protein [Bacteroidota bacterium]
MIPEQTGSLPQTNLTTHPGLCRIYAIDLEDIESMPDLKSMMKSIRADSDIVHISDIVLKAGGAILSIVNDNQVGSELTEDDKASSQNSYYPYTVAFVLPNDDANTRGKLLRAYYNRQFVVLIKQATGAWRILGSKHRGCDLKATLDTGTQSKGANEYKCTFTWESGQRAYYMKDPNFRVLNITSAVYSHSIPGDFLVIHYDAHHFTGTEAGTIQMYVNGAWSTLDVYSVTTIADHTYTLAGTMSAGTYFVRLLSSTGVVSNTVVITV